MRYLLKISVIVLSAIFFLNFVGIVACSEEKVYFSEGFESGFHGWKRTDGLIIFPRTERFLKNEGQHAFRMTGRGTNNSSGYAGRYQHDVNIPVTVNTTFNFAYYFFQKWISYVGYQIGFNDGKQGLYISLFQGYFVNISGLYLIQYKMEGRHVWNSHRARIFSDYKRAFGNIPPGLNITYVALVMGDPYRSNESIKPIYKIIYKILRPIQTAFFDNITIYEDPTNYPPDPPSRASGLDRGIVNASYRYHIQAFDPNNNNVRIYCQYENNTGKWSDWIKSGESATFDLQWNSKGKHVIKSYAQDQFLFNSTWSEPFTVFINDSTYPLMVFDPNGNEQLTLGGNYTISWSSTDETGENVKIELYKEGNAITIVNSTQNDGSYFWQIPINLPPGMDYKIRISSVTDPSIHDLSDSSFGLEKPIDFDLEIIPMDILVSDWTPELNQSIQITAMVSRFKGSQAVNATLYFYVQNLNDSTTERILINSSRIYITQARTSWSTQWTPIEKKNYRLSVKIIIEDDKEEFSPFNNEAIATQDIRVGATDDELLLIPPKETTRVIDSGNVLINLTVICGSHNLTNVRVDVFDAKDFTCKISTQPRDLAPFTSQQYWIEVTPSRLSSNFSSVQKQIIVRALGESNDGGTIWTSNMGSVIVEVYRPQSTLAEVTILSVFVGGLVAIFSLFITETGKYKLFSFLSLMMPLFTHIRSEEVLENFVRGQIYGYIKTNPGSHYNNIRKALEIGNGTLAHHLSMLEKTGLIKSRQEGIRYRLFYPTEMKFPEIRKYMLSELQLALLKIIGSKPGISQKEIVSMQNASQQTISYNLKELEKVREIVSMKKHGRRYYFIPPNIHTNY